MSAATKPASLDNALLPAPMPPEGAPSPRASSRWERWQLVLLGVVGLLPGVLAVAQLGRIHPDEVYQVLEPAWHRVHGYGILAWEGREGLRNWAVPLVASWVLRLAHALGITHPVAYRAMLAVPQAALHGWMLWATYRFARRRAGHRGGVLAALLMGLYGPVLVFAGRTLGESFSAALLVVGLEALDRTERPTRAGLLGGLALGLAVVTRYASAVFVLAALVWLVGARRWRQLAFCCLAGGAVALGLGALDWATWGTPFHSFQAYVRFNVLSGGAAAQFGESPASWYLPLLPTAVPGWAWLALPLGLLAWRRRFALSLPLVCAAVYLAALSATAHKEERFLYPALVLGLLAAAPAVAGFVLARGRVLRGALVALALGATLLPRHFFPSGDLRADQFRAIVAATQDPRTKGLLIVNEGVWGAGGFFYIGRYMPWRVCDWPQDLAFRASMADPNFNRAVTFEGRALAELQAAGFRVVGQVGRETILARD
jgi:hypothetical protein